MGRAGQVGCAAEAAQTLLAHDSRERSDAHLLDVEGVVERTEAERAALAQELGVQMLEAAQRRRATKASATSTR